MLKSTNWSAAVFSGAVVAAAVTLLLPIPASAQAIDLGSGPVATPGKVVSGTSAVAVDGKVAVGSVTFDDGTFHAVAWTFGTPGSFVDLGTLPTNPDNPLGGNWSLALGVSGKIVVAMGDGGAFGSPRALVYELGKDVAWRDLGTLGGALAVPTDVSDGVVCGWSTTASWTQAAFVYNLKAAAPAMIALDDGSGYIRATAVDRGLVVGWGYYGSTAFAYDVRAASPTMVYLPPLPGGSYAGAYGVSGRIAVGESGASDGKTHVVAWDLTEVNTPVVYDLGVGTLTATGMTEDPLEIIDGSIVIGAAVIGGTTYPAAWDIRDLSHPRIFNLDPSGRAGAIAKAVSGKLIVGDLTDADGRTHAFAYDLAAPTPALIDLGTLAGWASRAWAVSGNTVVGEWYDLNADGTTGATHAALWQLHNLKVGTVGEGTVSPAGGTFLGGTTVTPTATPGPNAVFQGWSGACSGTGPCAVTMNADEDVTATFGPRQVATLLVLSGSPSPSAFMANVTFTATVSPAEAAGTVTIGEGATALGSCVLSSGRCAFSTSALAAGSHSLTAAYNGDSSFAGSTANATQVVNPATLAVDYVGDEFVPPGTTRARLRAQLTGPAACLRNQAIAFAYDPGTGAYMAAGTGTTDASGLATFSWPNPPAGLLDVEVRFAGSGNCSAAVSTGAIVVAGVGDSSHGAGWYKPQGRVNFGYTARVKTVRSKTTTTGRLVWQSPRKYRVTGTIDGYTQVACPIQAPSLARTACGFFQGRGDYYVWNSATSHWALAASGIVFQVTVADGGASKGRKGRFTNHAGYFRMNLPTLTVAGETATLLPIGGGNITVR